MRCADTLVWRRSLRACLVSRVLISQCITQTNATEKNHSASQTHYGGHRTEKPRTRSYTAGYGLTRKQASCKFGARASLFSRKKGRCLRLAFRVCTSEYKSLPLTFYGCCRGRQHCVQNTLVLSQLSAVPPFAWQPLSRRLHPPQADRINPFCPSSLTDSAPCVHRTKRTHRSFMACARSKKSEGACPPPLAASPFVLW